MTAPALTDDAVRRRITEEALDELLFVEAGAGTGKTSQLVGRVAALVLAQGVPMREIAAITFTEAAAAELRTRIRETFERSVHDPAVDEGARARAERALGELDVAAIGTVHSFAQRILAEHPVEAGLPPDVAVLDEVESLLEFGTRWQEHVDAMFADPDLGQVLALASLLRIRLDGTKVASLRDIAACFADNWDRLDPLVDEPVRVPSFDREAAVRALAALGPVFERCETIAGDKLAAKLLANRGAIEHLRELLARGPDRVVLRAVLAKEGKWGGRNLGRAADWGGKEEKAAVMDAVEAAEEALAELGAAATDAVLRILAGEVARFTVASADERRRAGRLEFHDLLVLARRLLRGSAEARAALHRRYSRLLVDEFQDTDPIQVELTTLVAASVDELDPGTPWTRLPVAPERLFFVGDPKQSIYRFRRADISLYLAARDRFAGGVEELRTNFRTVPTVLDWVNHVFGALMAEEVPGRSPRYSPLTAHRCDHGDHRVTLLGGPHPSEEGLRAAPLRELEAATVADAVAGILATPDEWPVQDGDEWRPARAEDIAVLVPTRTSLGALMGALRDRDVEFRSETGTLVYETQEVRDLVAILRAVAHGTDAVSLVAALRSPILGCGDDDLVAYVAAGGRWDIGVPPPDGLPADHPVVAALAYLAARRAERWWTPPSVLLERVIRDRCVLAIALASPRARDTWRRLRFLVDQARLYEASQSADLVGFVAWAELQRSEMARVHEPALPESDDRAVRIMTIHGAKGLEFPITVVSGLTTRLGRRRARFSAHWDGDAIEVSARKDVATAGFDRLADLEAEMDAEEKLRLLYVACTRARDHLLIAAHHIADAKTQSFARMVWEATATAPSGCWRTLEPADAPVAEVADPFADASFDAEAREAWIARRDALLAEVGRPRVVSATALRRSFESGRDRVTLGAEAPRGEPEAAFDPEHTWHADPWRRGRAATAFGRAVHAVLQDVDLVDPTALLPLAEVAARAEGIGSEADAVAAAARVLWDAPIVRHAAAVGAMREVYVAGPVGGVTVEGYVDLLVREEDLLTVVDYKTDALDDPAAVVARAQEYRPQLAAYALALRAATGATVAGGVLVFATAAGAVEHRFALADLDPTGIEAALAGW